MQQLKPSRVLRLGLAAGLIATVVMDLAMAGTLELLGEPPGVFFSFIGEAFAAFMALLGMNVHGSVALGAALHYMIGLFLGVVFVALVRRGILPAGTAGLTLLVGVVYVQATSLLFLIPAARLLRLAPPDLRDLFGLAVVFHGAWGLVLGAVCLYGTRGGGREKPNGAPLGGAVEDEP